MPTSIRQALSDRILTDIEANEIEQSATADDVEVIVEEIAAAVHTDPAKALLLDSEDKRQTVNGLLGRLDQKKPLTLDRSATRPDGSIDFLTAMRTASSGALAKPTYGGQSVNIATDGSILVNGQAVPVGPSAATLDAMLALGRPGQLTTLTFKQRQALSNTLVAIVDACLPAPTDQPEKFKRLAIATSALYALGTVGRTLSSDAIDKLQKKYEAAANPLAKCFLMRAVDAAPMTAAQQAIRQAWSEPYSDALIANFATAAARTGLDAKLKLIGATFARDMNAVAAFARAADVYGTLNAGGTALDDEEAAAFLADLEPYINQSSQSAFAYGAFASAAPKHVAAANNARLVPAWTAALASTPPTFAGQILSAAQAAKVSSWLPGVGSTDDAAALAQLWVDAKALFGLSPDAPVTDAAFGLVARHVDAAYERRQDTENGMIDVAALVETSQTHLAAIQAELAPALGGLAATPATFASVLVSGSAAALLRTTLANHLRSEMSLTNLFAAVKVLAPGGTLTAAEEQKLGALLDFYRAQFPGTGLLDFNKLARFAQFFAAGQTVPLATINGVSKPFGTFFSEVARAVTSAIAADSVDQPWMAERYGQRAKQSIELLDVVAQQTAEGKGPIATLQKSYPGRAITIHAQASDGAHNEFVYAVDGIGRFTQGSDGAIAKNTQRLSNVMFTAAVSAQGTLDLKIPASGTLRMSGYPLQTTYAVGDQIDIRFIDPAAADVQEEGKKYSSEHKVLPATIESFDAAGHYTVRYQKPDGEIVRASMDLQAIAEENNPHWFSLNDSTFSDVYINVDQQPGLRAFLAGAQEVINKYLPVDGSVFDKSTLELTSAQRACVEALQNYMRPLMTYPVEKGPTADPASASYHEMVDALSGWDAAPLEDYLKLKRGVCRHQCIIEQLALQLAGIDSRLASGAANTEAGNFRGYHIWNELSLADNSRYLSDQTWNDALIPLWNGAYDTDLRRIEMYQRTARYDGYVV